MWKKTITIVKYVSYGALLLTVLIGLVTFLVITQSSTPRKIDIETELTRYNDTLILYKAQLASPKILNDSVLNHHYSHLNKMEWNLLKDWENHVNSIGIKYDTPLVRQTIMVEEFMREKHELQLKIITELNTRK